MKTLDFQPVFEPRSIAVIGASGDSTKFGGRTYLGVSERVTREKLYAVNPNAPEINGKKAYTRIQEIDDDIDPLNSG